VNNAERQTYLTPYKNVATFYEVSYNRTNITDPTQSKLVLCDMF